MNVLDLRGPAFLIVYSTLIVVSAIALAVVRLLIRRTPASADEFWLDAFELALLADGERRVTMLAVAALVDRGRATLQAGRLSFLGHALGPNVHPIERALLADRPTTLRGARHALREPIATMRRSLEGDALFVGAGARSVYRAITFAGWIGLLAIGVAKIAVGLSRERPVGFLVILTVAAFVGGLTAIAVPPSRSTSGDALLKRRRREWPVTKRPSVKAPILPDTEAGTSVALWGLSALCLHPAYGDFRAAFAAGDGGGWTDKSSSGSSCSSTCGGGGGCGG